MTEDYTKELNQKNIREKLNAEKIKLWLPPYTTESGEKGETPQVRLHFIKLFSSPHTTYMT